MGSATSTSGRTCTPTLSSLEAPPCTPVLLTVCRRRSPPWPPPPSRSRSSLPPRESTPSGSEAPSWLPSPPSSRCGSPSRSTTSLALALSTGSASKLLTYHIPYRKVQCLSCSPPTNCSVVEINVKEIRKKGTSILKKGRHSCTHIYLELFFSLESNLFI